MNEGHVAWFVEQFRARDHDWEAGSSSILTLCLSSARMN
jgi:hypothetical protein